MCKWNPIHEQLMNTKKKFILVSLMTLSLVALLGVSLQQISSDEADEKQYVMDLIDTPNWSDVYR